MIVLGFFFYKINILEISHSDINTSHNINVFVRLVFIWEKRFFGSARAFLLSALEAKMNPSLYGTVKSS